MRKIKQQSSSSSPFPTHRSNTTGLMDGTPFRSIIRYRSTTTSITPVKKSKEPPLSPFFRYSQKQLNFGLYGALKEKKRLWTRILYVIQHTAHIGTGKSKRHGANVIFHLILFSLFRRKRKKRSFGVLLS
jgi:hypothetical protein